jgi:hypothetical protein
MEFIRLKNDANGNPRVAVHFLEIPISKLELKAIKKDIYFIENRYQIALSKAKKIGGKVYKGKNLGGCFVFSKHINDKQLEEKILSL